MAVGDAPRILGVCDGDPWDHRTWSGCTAGIYGALRDRGALLDAVDAHTALATRRAQAASFHPSRAVWWQRYFGGVHRAGGAARRLRTRAGIRRAGARLRDADAVLQAGAWLDFTR